MIEFTYNGVVRHGFGFFNPNHAAALCCALLPFMLYAWQRWPKYYYRIATVAIIAALLAAIALTYSRTGVLVLLFELLLLAGLLKKKWKLLLLLFLSALLIFALMGVLSRFRPDDSISNRPLIWQAGLALFAANPWGIGFANSGLAASAFLLENIHCRTLISSHLTLLVEWGILAGFFYLTAIFYAVLHGGRRHPFLLTSFAGLLLSAGCASLFDWQLLFAPEHFPEYTATNQFMAWLAPIFFLALLIVLIWGKMQWKKLLTAAAISVILLLTLLIYPSSAPEIHHGIARKNGDSMPLLLYDDSWQIKALLPFVTEGYQIPLRSCQYQTEPPATQADAVLFFGESATFSRHYPDARQIFIDPPEFFTLPATAAALHLPRFSDKTALQEQARQKQIRCSLY